jgi:outer membrane autotransporter protein
MLAFSTLKLRNRSTIFVVFVAGIILPSAFLGYLGLRSFHYEGVVHKNFFVESAHSIQLEGGAAWWHEYATRDDTMHARLASSPGSDSFIVEGTPRDRDTLALEVGIHVAISRNWVGSMRYSTNLGSNGNSQTLWGVLNVKW